MLLFHRALLVVAFVLVEGMDSASTASDVEMPDLVPSTPSLRANSLIESADGDVVKRSLRETNKAQDHAFEERGIFKRLFGKQLDLKTVSDEKLVKLLNDEKAKLKAFQYLERNDVDSNVAYVRLGGPTKIEKGDTRWKFLEEYGKWYEPRNYQNY